MSLLIKLKYFLRIYRLFQVFELDLNIFLNMTIKSTNDESDALFNLKDFDDNIQ